MPEWIPSLGALFDGAGTTFRVWAPDYEQIDVVIERVRMPSTSLGGAPDATPDTVIRSLSREPSGYWSGRFDDIRPGALYRYRLNASDGQVFPDPASRFQPHGVHGPSQVVDAATFPWTDDAWTPPTLDRIVFYELHIGTFSPRGTYRGAIDHLPHLVELGISAIELMPVGDFPGNRNWGYDGVSIFAPARCYGSPDDLRALIDVSHAHGLAVFLDVVYNHLGPDGAYAHAFSPYYFTDAHRSPWGGGVNLDGSMSAEVRRFFIENALHWVREYHVDGFRLDATHEMQDESPLHFLAELSTTLRAHSARPVLIVAEDHRNLARMVQPVDRGGYGLDAVWADDFHHQARVHTAHDREGYYIDFTGTTADLATTLRQGWFFTGQHSSYLGGKRGTDPLPLALRQFIICAQNHDQIGNRADGGRLNHDVDRATYRALTVLLLLAPQTPLLFMGQEWAASTPFLFFTDHHEALGRSVTQGRRAEFAAFAAFADPERRANIPDPQNETTFERSRLAWDERTCAPHAGVLRLHQQLLSLRRTVAAWRHVSRDSFDVAALDDGTIRLTLSGKEAHGDEYTVIARLSGSGSVKVAGTGELVLSTEDVTFTDDAQPMRITARSRSADRGEETEVHFWRAGAIVLRRCHVEVGRREMMLNIVDKDRVESST
jgi:maltooligosyltrehalose trehalohydrolase